MSKIKLLAFTPIFYPHMGGAERTVYELYSRCAKQYGYEIDLVTLNTENAIEREILNGIHVIRIGKPYQNKYIKFLMLQILFLKFYFINRNKKYQILHVHYAFPLSIAIFILKFFTNIKIIISEYHFGTGADIVCYKQNPSYANYISGYIYKIADKVLTISNDNHEFIKKVSKRDDAIVIKQGTDHHFFHPCHRTNESNLKYRDAFNYLFVTTSRISKRKNLEDMIKAISLLKKYNLSCILYICGKTEYGQETYLTHLKNMTIDLDVENNVIFCGFVSDEELRVIYACADLFLLTSQYEGFGIANTEALASGTPVITYDTKAAKDFIIDFYNGFVVKNNSPEELAQIIIQILQEGIYEMSNNARKCVEKELNWNLYAQINHKIIDELLQKKRDCLG